MQFNEFQRSFLQKALGPCQVLVLGRLLHLFEGLPKLDRPDIAGSAFECVGRVRKFIRVALADKPLGIIQAVRGIVEKDLDQLEQKRFIVLEPLKDISEPDDLLVH